jgi:hypothetical protein
MTNPKKGRQQKRRTMPTSFISFALKQGKPRKNAAATGNSGEHARRCWPTYWLIQFRVCRRKHGKLSKRKPNCTGIRTTGSWIKSTCLDSDTLIGGIAGKDGGTLLTEYGTPQVRKTHAHSPRAPAPCAASSQSPESGTLCGAPFST